MTEASPRWRLPAFFLILAALFLIANRGAYKGYFQDDDLDNLSFTREISLSDFLVPLVYPRVYTNNFRPTGHLFYRWMGKTVGLNYVPYIAILHLIHFINVLLLWRVLRKLGLSYLGAGAAAVFFAFHMAAFDVFWKPMYIFDLLCGLFSLLSLLAYLNDRWLMALFAMFAAYRSKEVAIMLPVLFAGYELLLGGRRWKRLIPFFALSVVIGIQAIVQNRAREENAYKLHFDPRSIWICVQYYSSRIFFIPYAGLLILPLLIIRDARLRFGITSFCILIFPMLILPGRLFSPYLYVPFIGLAIAVAALASRTSVPVLAAIFLVWLGWNYVQLRHDRNTVLADSHARRTYTGELTDFNRTNPAILAYVYNSGPVNAYGTGAILKLAHPVGTHLQFATVDDDSLSDVLKSSNLAVIGWNTATQYLRTLIRTPSTPYLSYLKMSEDTPLWQLERGWYGFEGVFRWTKPSAFARLNRPAGTKRFELTANISPAYIEKVGRSRLAVTLDGKAIGDCEFSHPGWQTVGWNLTPSTGGLTEVGLQVTPPLEAGRSLGIAVGGFGFAQP